MKKTAILVFVASVVALACGGGGGQSMECKSYTECLDKTGTGTAQLKDTYGPSGTCWKGEQATIDGCNTGCKNGLDALKLGYPDAGC